MKRKYLAVFQKGPGNYSGYLPDVPGCVSVGETLAEMRAMMIEAVQFHFEGMMEDGLELLNPVTTIVDFSEDNLDHGVEHCVVEWLEVEIPRSVFAQAMTA